MQGPLFYPNIKSQFADVTLLKYKSRIGVKYLQSLKNPHEYNNRVPVCVPHITFLPFESQKN